MLLPAAWLGLNCAIWAAAAAGSVAAEIGPPVLDTNVVPEKWWGETAPSMPHLQQD